MKIHYWDKLIDSKHHELVDLYGYFVFYVDLVLSSMTDNNCTRLHYMSNTEGVLPEDYMSNTVGVLPEDYMSNTVGVLLETRRLYE